MAYTLQIEYILRLTLLTLCIKDFEFINMKLRFKVKCAVKSQDDGCPLRRVVTGNEHEWGLWGAGSVLSLALFASYVQSVKITALDT